MTISQISDYQQLAQRPLVKSSRNCQGGAIKEGIKRA